MLEQEYSNYRVIFIDDCSTDSTLAEAALCVETLSAEERVTFIHNESNHKALYNVYYAIQTLSDDEIVIVLDGDDWFSHGRVLKEINRYYNDPNVWMTYGQYITYPKYEKGKVVQSSIRRENVRGRPAFPQPRTFYAGLFKKIKMKDLIYEGDFYPSSWDLAVMLPLWEMAKEHSVFIPDVLYVYNRESPLNDDKIHKENQLMYNRYIQSLPAYAKLDNFREVENREGVSALCVFSENRPTQLLSFLESIEKRGKDFSPIHVFYTSSEPEYEKGYSIVKDIFEESVKFHTWQGEEGFLATIRNISEDYITFAKDTFVINREIDGGRAIRLLEKAGAYAVYFDLGLNVEAIPSKVLAVQENAFIWDFSKGEKEWAVCNRLDMTLYKKEKVLPFLQRIHFRTMKEFETNWKKGVDLHQVGLFFKESHAVNIPFQITKLGTSEQILLYTEKELLDRLLEGYKIDIAPVANIENHSREIDFYPHFLER